MPISEELSPTATEAFASDGSDGLTREIQSLLERAFGVQFTILDGITGEVLFASPEQPPRDWGMRADICREIANRSHVEFIDDEDPLLTLALPLVDASGDTRVAVATFLARNLTADENLAHPSELLGMRQEDALTWARRQIPRPAETLQRLGDMVLEFAHTTMRMKKLERESHDLSLNLSLTYEEISLLYQLTQNLKLSKSDEDLGRMALEGIGEVVLASGLLLQLLPVSTADKMSSHAARTQSALLCYGDCPLDNAQFSELIAYLAPNAQHPAVVANRPLTEQPGWPCPQIREIIVVAIAEGENIFGWLAAVNHVKGEEFGTVEASLMSSVAAILGIHRGNIELYRQQSELLEGIVRALTSAIAAKDPYTRGHSDRVARVAVRLAKELGCDAKMLDMLYLAGLLHDIGKIGIDDSVLRKAGKLSDEEYKHIKQHVNIGHRILHDLSKLEDVLPVVLHHHESWDGRGYPQNLDAERIPLAARIVAVADAFDAMSSDRPYRKGMPDEKVDSILREGAGRQWDPKVIDAYFSARDDIRRISHETELPADLELVGLA